MIAAQRIKRAPDPDGVFENRPFALGVRQSYMTWIEPLITTGGVIPLSAAEALHPSVSHAARAAARRAKRNNNLNPSSPARYLFHDVPSQISTQRDQGSVRGLRSRNSGARFSRTAEAQVVGSLRCGTPSGG